MNESHQNDPRDHVEMWKHYDNLRQAKNTGFLTTNSILVAIVGFLIRACSLGVVCTSINSPIVALWSRSFWAHGAAATVNPK